MVSIGNDDEIMLDRCGKKIQNQKRNFQQVGRGIRGQGEERDVKWNGAGAIIGG